jgi:hypothetical protein
MRFFVSLLIYLGPQDKLMKSSSYCEQGLGGKV